MAVVVLDRKKRPLMACSEKRAELLLERSHLRVHRVRPFVIRLVNRTGEGCILHLQRLKLNVEC